MSLSVSKLNSGKYRAPPKSAVTPDEKPSVAGSKLPSCCRTFGSWNRCQPARISHNERLLCVHVWS